MFEDYDFADEINDKKIVTKIKYKTGFVVKETILNDDKYLKEKNGNYYAYILKDNVDEELLIKELSKQLKKLINSKIKKVNPKIFVFGIGNEYYSSDSLGPKTLKKIDLEIDKKDGYRISLLIPGVKGQTNLDTSLIANAIKNEFDIDLIIVVDSLITHQEERIFKVIQLSDVGLAPGSGLNNKRLEISEKSLKIPVLCIGVATCISSKAILENACKQINDFSKLKEIINQKETLYYSLKDAEEEINYFSNIISSSINLLND